jgi:hypothetical protein
MTQRLKVSSAAGFEHGVSRAFQHRAQEFSVRDVIVGDQYLDVR